VGGVDGEVPLKKKSTFKGNGVALGSECGYETITVSRCFCSCVRLTTVVFLVPDLGYGALYRPVTVMRHSTLHSALPVHCVCLRLRRRRFVGRARLRAANAT
jgi:hypothetical protein